MLAQRTHLRAFAQLAMLISGLVPVLYLGTITGVSVCTYEAVIYAVYVVQKWCLCWNCCDKEQRSA